MKMRNKKELTEFSLELYITHYQNHYSTIYFEENTHMSV